MCLEGQRWLFATKKLVSLQYRKQKDSSEYGVFGAVPGIAGAVQAAEVVKLIAGVGKPLVNRMMSFDALAMKFNVISVAPSDLCVLRHSE